MQISEHEFHWAPGLNSGQDSTECKDWSPFEEFRKGVFPAGW
jgi:hypothetical protein